MLQVTKELLEQIDEYELWMILDGLYLLIDENKRLKEESELITNEYCTDVEKLRDLVGHIIDKTP